MNIKLEFEDIDEALVHTNGKNYALALDAIDSKLRYMSKYQDVETITIDEARELVRNCMEGFNVNLDMLL